MNKLRVVGTSYLDVIDIIHNDKYTKKIQDGGIYNIQQGSKFTVNTAISNIVINQYGQDVATKWNGNVGSINNLYEDFEDEWVHLAYVNTCDIDLGKVKAKVKSCDLTGDNWFKIGEEKIISNILLCDYVFVAREHLDLLLSKIKNVDYSGWLVSHDSQGSTLLKPNYKPFDPLGSISPYEKYSVPEINFRHNKENFLFTVGAGDKFAGHFIEARMSGLELGECQKIAHEKVLLWLKEVNESL